jgi:hypothetical protein
LQTSKHAQKKLESQVVSVLANCAVGRWQHTQEARAAAMTDLKALIKNQILETVRVHCVYLVRAGWVTRSFIRTRVWVCVSVCACVCHRQQSLCRSQSCQTAPIPWPRCVAACSALLRASQALIRDSSNARRCGLCVYGSSQCSGPCVRVGESG